MEYDTKRVAEYMESAGLKPMDLVRLCGVAVSTAHRLKKAEPINDLDVLYKVYVGLRDAGYNVTWLYLTGIE